MAHAAFENGFLVWVLGVVSAPATRPLHMACNVMPTRYQNGWGERWRIAVAVEPPLRWAFGGDGMKVFAAGAVKMIPLANWTNPTGQLRTLVFFNHRRPIRESPIAKCTGS